MEELMSNIAQHLVMLNKKHDNLDEHIRQMSSAYVPDEMVTALKKEKLLLKDKISLTEYLVAANENQKQGHN
jgi:hypothetical protein